MGVLDAIFGGLLGGGDSPAKSRFDDMTPQQLAQALPNLSDDDLSQIDHAKLYSARQYVPKDQQNRISPYEHRAFAREATAENPLMALPIAVGTVAYQPYKALMGSRSTPSLDQVTQGLKGVGEGIISGARSRLAK